MYELNWFGKLLFAISLTFILILLIGAYWNSSLSPFLKKRKLIIMELNRSSDSKKKFWKRKLYKNYLRLIPFVDWINKKRKKRRSHFRRHRHHRRHRYHRYH